ncbi:MAG: hypothetical protein AAGA65_15520 [Actinomycetota bacterium]
MLQVPIIGHEFDLDDLEAAFADQDPGVVRDPDGRLWLQASTFGSHGRHAELVLDEARTLLDQFVGLLRLAGHRTQELQLGRSYRTPPDETGRCDQVVLLGTAVERSRAGSIRAVVTSEDGTTQMVSEAPHPLDIAAPDGSRHRIEIDGLPGRALESLRLLGGPDVGWAELYKVKDNISGHYGGPKNLPFDLTDDPADWTRFNQSANSWEISGPAGRHGMRNEQPQDAVDPMELDEARRFIRTVVVRWLVREGWQIPPGRGPA